MTSRPTLKLKLSTSGHVPTQSSFSPQASSSTASTPKIKLKIGGSASSPPADSKPTITFRAAKKPRPQPATKRKSQSTSGPAASKASKKRSKPSEELGSDAVVDSSKIKRIKINHGRASASGTPITPIIRAKLKGKPPVRPLGVGYDSESSDREIDPHIEEEFILRMTPGEDCDYLRKAIEEKTIGIPKRDGGAEVSMKFFNRDGRRAVVTIQHRHYAATMVDLPCVIEGMKSWDKRGWWKTADICQMLLVLGRVEKEEAALTMPLPPAIDPVTHQYPHGLTPPMHNVRKNRFRKRVSNKTIEAVEDEVERLLAADLDVGPGGSSYEIIDVGHDSTRDNSVAPSDQGGFNMLGGVGMHEAEDGEEEEYEDDAEGEVDDGDLYAEFGTELEANIEQAMMEDDADAGADVDGQPATAGGETSVTAATAPIVVPASAVTTAAPTPSAETPTSAEAEEEEEEEDDDDDDDGEEDDAEDEVDEDTLARQKDLARQQEEIADLEAAIANERAKLDTMKNPLFRKRQKDKIESLEGDLALKRGGSGEGEDGEA